MWRLVASMLGYTFKKVFKASQISKHEELLHTLIALQLCSPTYLYLLRQCVPEHDGGVIFRPSALTLNAETVSTTSPSPSPAATQEAAAGLNQDSQDGLLQPPVKAHCVASQDADNKEVGSERA